MTWSRARLACVWRREPPQRDFAIAIVLPTRGEGVVSAHPRGDVTAVPSVDRHAAERAIE